MSLNHIPYPSLYQCSPTRTRLATLTHIHIHMSTRHVARDTFSVVPTLSTRRRVPFSVRIVNGCARACPAIPNVATAGHVPARPPHVPARERSLAFLSRNIPLEKCTGDDRNSYHAKLGTCVGSPDRVMPRSGERNAPNFDAGQPLLCWRTRGK